MHWRHELVSELLVPLDFGDLVVTRPPIGVDLRPGPDDLLDDRGLGWRRTRRGRVGSGCARCLARSALPRSPDALGFRLSPGHALLVATHAGLIDFDTPAETAPPRLGHGAAHLADPGSGPSGSCPSRGGAEGPRRFHRASDSSRTTWPKKHNRNGLRVSSKIVPAIADVCRWHAAHRSRPRAVVQAVCPLQAEHRKPSGHRRRRSKSVQAASDAYEPAAAAMRQLDRCCDLAVRSRPIPKGIPVDYRFSPMPPMIIWSR